MAQLCFPAGYYGEVRFRVLEQLKTSWIEDFVKANIVSAFWLGLHAANARAMVPNARRRFIQVVMLD